MEIIERLKAATGPDRILDRSIIGVLVDAGEVESHPLLVDVPHYTASLDAALTLVPRGLYWVAGYGKTCEREPLGGAAVYKPGADGFAYADATGEGEAATPTIALCIAALLARAR